MNNMIFGNYYYVDSFVHKLDPRVKLLANLLFLIGLFVFTSFKCYVLISLFLIIMIFLSKIPIRELFKSKLLMFTIIVTAFFNMFWLDGKIIFTLGKFTISEEGLKLSIFISVRLLYLFVSSSILLYTTTQNKIVEGMSKALSPLKKIKIPVEDFSMIIAIMLRFIPVLTEEAIKIKKAQNSRGTNFETKNIRLKIKNYIPLFVPLFVSAFTHSNELAIAMEARGYSSSGKRGKLNPLKYTKADIFSYIFLLFFLIILILTKVFFN